MLIKKQTVATSNTCESNFWRLGQHKTVATSNTHESITRKLGQHSGGGDAGVIGIEDKIYSSPFVARSIA